MSQVHNELDVEVFQQKQGSRLMETLNLAVISGNIGEPASVLKSSDGSEYCVFSVITYKVVKTENGKTRIKEEIPVLMNRPGTIAKYLLRGKSVVIQGRVASLEDKSSNLIASAITFPGNKTHDE